VLKFVHTLIHAKNALRPFKNLKQLTALVLRFGMVKKFLFYVFESLVSEKNFIDSYIRC